MRFIAEDTNATRVELEHRHLDRYGTRRDEMRAIFVPGPKAFEAGAKFLLAHGYR